MFETFTEQARQVVVAAQEEARSLDHLRVGTEHLLVGLIREGNEVTATALGGLSLDMARREVEAITGRGKDRLPSTIELPFTLGAKKALELSSAESARFDHRYVGPEHILLSLIREDDDVVAHLFARTGVDRTGVREELIQQLSDS